MRARRAESGECGPSVASADAASFFSERAAWSGDTFFAFDLGAMHDAPRIRIEGIAPVQHREIVPHEQIANLPFMIHGEPLLCGMCPQCIKHLFAVGYIHADDVAVWPT